MFLYLIHRVLNLRISSSHEETYSLSGTSAGSIIAMLLGCMEREILLYVDEEFIIS
jgi:hypothetical protein